MRLFKPPAYVRMIKQEGGKWFVARNSKRISPYMETEQEAVEWRDKDYRDVVEKKRQGKLI